MRQMLEGAADASKAGPRPFWKRSRWVALFVVAVVVVTATAWGYGRGTGHCTSNFLDYATGAVGAPTSREALDAFLARYATQDELPRAGWKADPTGLIYRSGDARVVLVQFGSPSSGFDVEEAHSC